jgi:lipopolysaccharide/colanic/teichoic acid biosynthesis glycosyltransferase
MAAEGRRVVASEAAEAVGDRPGTLPPSRELPAESQMPARLVGKRVFDVFVSAVALIAMAPLMLVLAILVKLDLPGPILFRSPRIGRHGEPFLMLKFRTMFDGANERRDDLRHLSEAPDGLFKMQRDPRLTRFGRLLRATSLDELPQLFQVLTGRMSLVGPRPLPPEEDALIGSAGLRLQARPGLTGPWQLAGSWRVPLTEMVEIDNDYLSNWSLWSDLKLLARTALHVFQLRGV